jgi:hypothetical protein
MFDAKTNTVKQLWHKLNEVCSFESKAHKTCNIPRLKNNNQIYTKPEDVCNELNSYFSTIGENLVNELMKSNNSNPSFRTYCNSFVKNSMFCDPVDKIELKTLINKLNDRKSSGPDNIGPKLVKKSVTAIVEPLVHIYNLSFATGRVPEKLKIAKVIPVFKRRSASTRELQTNFIVKCF